MQQLEPHTVWWRRIQRAFLPSALQDVLSRNPILRLAALLGAIVTILWFPIYLVQAFDWYRGLEDASHSEFKKEIVKSNDQAGLGGIVASAFSSQCRIRISDFQFTSETWSEVEGFQGFFGKYRIRGLIDSQEFSFHGHTNGMGPDREAARRSSIVGIPEKLAKEKIIDLKCTQ